MTTTTTTTTSIRWAKDLIEGDQISSRSKYRQWTAPRTDNNSVPEGPTDKWEPSKELTDLLPLTIEKMVGIWVRNTSSSIGHARTKMTESTMR